MEKNCAIKNSRLLLILLDPGLIQSTSIIIIETLFYCWRMHMGNYSQVGIVITSENIEFRTSD